MKLWLCVCVAVALLLQGTTRRISDMKMQSAMPEKGPLQVSAHSASQSLPDVRDLTDYYARQYAFVVKYKMQKIVGVEISHTSLVVCNRDEFQDYVDKFEQWCTSRQSWGRDCWKASSRWSSIWTSDVQVSLQTSMEQRSYYGGLGGCTEFEFADDGKGGAGIHAFKFGESMFFKEFKRREMDAWMSKVSKWGKWSKWGNWTRGLIMDKQWSINVYPVGPVRKQAVAKAIQKAESPGSVGYIYAMNFKPFTYESTRHNSHHFVDALLKILGLPYFDQTGGLPSSFMPEDSSKNPLSSTVGKAVQFVGENGKQTLSALYKRAFQLLERHGLMRMATQATFTF